MKKIDYALKNPKPYLDKMTEEDIVACFCPDDFGLSVHKECDPMMGNFPCLECWNEEIKEG